MNPDMNKKILFFLLMALLSLGLRAQEPYWQCNPGDYDYDMRIIVALELDGERITDLSNYDIAAFCGEECRGFVNRAEDGVIDSPLGQVGYMVICSDVTAGETITFKVYDKVNDKVLEVMDEHRNEISVDFVKDAVTGSGSSPFMLDITKRYILGDVNGDGKITTFDITRVVDYILNGNEANFIKVAADMNNDGKITTFDITQIVSIILNQ